MASCKPFKGIAFNLAQFCISRNNDYLGYWAIGQLYSFASQRGVKQITFNILNQEIDPESHQFSQLNALYIELIAKVAHRSKASFQRLTNAVVIFKFDVEYQHKHHYLGSDIGNPFLCVVELTSDLGRIYKAELGCNIQLHDPARESRRGNF
ncbi:hypothetical protein MHN79_11945 [Vibrio sp. Of14-4]|uniref:hypothetical protein n=1 Tax=Vibrio sp. Of14-4 TaxID=2724878 RepID=UPI001EF302C0|nr:hypothetical protein [Vibrio sp. Of14-4]MCG7490206.1 hypothetical protein [Vibrio sp. Of14-4]